MRGIFPARVAIRALAVAGTLLAGGGGGGPAWADPGVHRDEPPSVSVPVVPHPRLRPSGPVPVRSEDHPGFGRLIFGFAHPTPFTTTRDGDRVVVRFQGGATIGSSPTLPHNVHGFRGGVGQAEISLAPGGAVAERSSGNLVVLDVFDAAPVAATAASTQPVPPPIASPRPASPQPASPQPASPRPASPPIAAAPRGAPEAPPGTAPIEPVAAGPLPPAGAAPTEPPPGKNADGPAPAAGPAPPPGAAEAALPSPPPAAGPLSQGAVALAVTRAALPANSPGAAIVVPFEAGVGLAVFRRGATAVAVFDQTRPLDVAALRDDPVFRGAVVQVLPAATILRFGLAPEAQLAAARVPAGWRLSTGPAPAAAAIALTAADGRLSYMAAAPGHVVVVPDLATGDNLLIGTQTREGQGVAVARRSPEFAVLPTWQGVAVAPLSDRLELRVIPQAGASAPGFVLAASGGAALVLSPGTPASGALADAATLTRRFDFPDLPAGPLLTRLQSAIAAAAAHPPLARLKPRQDVAQAMIALGLGAEAEALLRMAVEDDPRGAADPTIGGLSAIAAMLAGRLEDDGAIDGPGLGDSDEVRFWRAVRTALTEEASPTAAAQFATTLPLLLAYPEAIQARLLPLVGETLVLGGQPESAAALFAKRPDLPSLDLARAMLQQVEGHTEAALAAYDRVAGGLDRLSRVRAVLRAAELRLASGAIKPAMAADEESRQLYAWRGDERERALRLRIAALRAQAGQWREALALLRESDGLFGPSDPRFAAGLRDDIRTLLNDDAADRLDPIALVDLVEENADLLPDGPGGEAMAAKFADRLDSLDLPRRADPVLDRLARTAAAPAARAEFGARLAALRLEGGDAAGALAALTASAGDGLSDGLRLRRTLLAASATARSGRPAEALMLLAPLTAPQAAEARAAISEQVADWPAAEAAMKAYVAATVPGDGPLPPDAARAVLRLAGDAARAGDDPGMAELRGSFSTRIADRSAAELFATLTAAPVRTLADLARSGREVAAERTLPQALRAAIARK